MPKEVCQCHRDLQDDFYRITDLCDFNHSKHDFQGSYLEEEKCETLYLILNDP